MDAPPPETPPSPPPSAAVLYVDHAGHPAPLGLCYHATASRVLSSSIDDRSPPSTSTEIDSAYCPQCLEFHDAARASGPELRGTCPGPMCRGCPACGAALGVKIGWAGGGEGEGEGESGEEGMVCFYRCGYCRWTSEGCSVTAEVRPAPDGTVGREEADRAADALLKSLKDRVASGGAAAADAAFRGLVEGWGKKAQEEERRRRQGDAAAVGGASSRRGGGDGLGGWSIDALEESVARRRAEASAVEAVGGMTLTRLTLEMAEAQGGGEAVRRPTARQGCSQLVVSPTLVGSEAELLPLPIPLRARKSRRCRAELAAGRPGILVKPKVNPLEGDSSLRSGQGQWWKKDSSAIHSVPKVQVLRHGLVPSAEGTTPRRALLLSVQNPTLGKVRLRFASSGVFLDPDALDGVVADAMNPRLRVAARWDGSATSGLRATDVIELDPVQDAFLEMGKGRSPEPDEVGGWDAAEVLPPAVDASLRVVAAQEDRAWLELILADERIGEGGGAPPSSASHVAAGLSLQIEVGDGSWESSLIKPLSREGGAADFVCLDLVILWEA